MKNIFKISFTIGILLFFSACDKFLEVQPEDKLTREQILASETAINSVLNGIYIDMASNSIYGANLSMTVLECLAQRYDLSSNVHRFYQYGQYNYADESVENTFNSIWYNLYRQVLEVNEFITLINMPAANLPDLRRKNTLLGESYALRAFYHFDLLRIFGPVYNSLDSTMLSIPYYEKGGGELMPLLPANEIMDKIVADLHRAEELLLQNDPIITDGMVTASTGSPVLDFHINRNYRMNYYAVKALQARVYLWREDKEAALAAAKVVINAQLNNNLFTWQPSNQLVGVVSPNTPNRIYSGEVIFGIHNRNMYTNHNNYFTGALLGTNLLAPRPARLLGANGTYENENDHRYYYVWLQPAEKVFRTLYKYVRPVDFTRVTFEYFQPIIRITEMYYIAAECETDLNKRVEYLTTVRESRNLITPINIADLDTEVRNEYAREFYAEGQLFFYYKRNFNRDGSTASRQIPNGNADNGNIIMTTANYVVPLPLAERNAR
jgi:hypothetical protein